MNSCLWNQRIQIWYYEFIYLNSYTYYLNSYTYEFIYEFIYEFRICTYIFIYSWIYKIVSFINHIIDYSQIHKELLWPFIKKVTKSFSLKDFPGIIIAPRKLHPSWTNRQSWVTVCLRLTFLIGQVNSWLYCPTLFASRWQWAPSST